MQLHDGQYFCMNSKIRFFIWHHGTFSRQFHFTYIEYDPFLSCHFWLGVGSLTGRYIVLKFHVKIWGLLLKILSTSWYSWPLKVCRGPGAIFWILFAIMIYWENYWVGSPAFEMVSFSDNYTHYMITWISRNESTSYSMIIIFNNINYCIVLQTISNWYLKLLL